MPIDPSKVGAVTEPYEVSWTSRDSMLYALGVGAGDCDLAYTTENSTGVRHRALPTMPVTLTRDARALKLLGDVNWSTLVHAEQEIELATEPAPEGRARAESRVDAIYDKGRAALVRVITSAHDAESGIPLFQTTSTMFLGGEGGWGGERGPASPGGSPTDKPDIAVKERTRPEQALLYRLSGDRNRLHSDPEIARRAGFERPILHGLCTYGFAGRALLEAVCDGDPARFGSMYGRFTAPVLPGDELTTRIWDAPDGALFETARSDGTVVLGSGRFTLRDPQTAAAAHLTGQAQR